MKKYWLLLLFVFGTVLSCTSYANGICAFSKSDMDIYCVIKKMRSNTIESTRIELSDRLPLATVACLKSGHCFKQEIVEDLIGFLDDKNEIVRTNAAIALGDLGEKAKSAVPFLKSALLHDSAMPGLIGPDLGSRAAISRALEKIIEGGKNKP